MLNVFIVNFEHIVKFEQLTFSCSKPAIEKIEKAVKYVLSSQCFYLRTLA